MEGIDGFVFTAGIGENSPEIREAVAQRLTRLGLELDLDANAKGERRISRQGSRIAFYVIPTDEERSPYTATARTAKARRDAT